MGGAGLETARANGTVELVVGANRDADAGFRTGAAYAVFLTPAGGTDQVVQLAPQPGVLFNELDDNDRFGVSLAPLGDLDGDGNPEIAVGAILDDDGGGDRGAVYILHTETPVPEPGMVLGLASGVALLARLRRKRMRS